MGHQEVVIDPVIVDGKEIGFQWEHIWFIRRSTLNRFLTITENCYKDALEIKRAIDGQSKFDNVWDREIEELINL